MNMETGKDRIMQAHRIGRLLAFSSLVGIALSSGAALAQCSLDAWDGSSGSPGSGDLTGTRYVGECGFVPSSAGQYVQDTIDGGATEYVVSFYALTKFNAGSTSANTVTVFEALANSSSALSLTIRGDETAVLTSGGSTSAVAINQSANYNGWNHYKITWSNGGSAALAVNGGTAVTTTGSSGTLDTARLGHVSSSTPNLQTNGLSVDQFVSLRTDDAAQTGVLCAGDTNDDNFLNVTDVLQSFNDGSVDIVGQPDYNGDGFVNVQDVLAINANAGPCPSL